MAKRRYKNVDAHRPTEMGAHKGLSHWESGQLARQKALVRVRYKWPVEQEPTLAATLDYSQLSVQGRKWLGLEV